MGWESPTPARHAARLTPCVGGLCRRLPRAGIGATQTTTGPVRDWRSEVSNTHTYTHTRHVNSWSSPGALRALH